MKIMMSANYSSPISLKLSLLFILLHIFSCKNKSENFILPTEKPIAEAVYASGSIYPLNEYRLFAATEGTIIAKLVSEGEKLSKGQLIYRIENISQTARTNAANVLFRQSKINAASNSPILQEIENQIDILKKKQANDLLNLNRQKALWEQNATTRIAYDAAELTYNTTNNQVAAVIQNKQKIINQLNVELENARTNYTINNREAENYLIIAQKNGMVYELLKKEGEQVHRGEAVALLGDAQENYLQLAVDETDYMKVQPGQKVIVKLDVAADKIYEAIISKKYPKLNRLDQTFRVDATFNGTAPEALHGLTLEANILIQQKPKALTIPKSYLVGNDSLWAEQNGEVHKIKITKGIENLEEVEILTGLNKNSHIILPQN